MDDTRLPVAGLSEKSIWVTPSDIGLFYQGHSHGLTETRRFQAIKEHSARKCSGIEWHGMGTRRSVSLREHPDLPAGMEISVSLPEKPTSDLK